MFKTRETLTNSCYIKGFISLVSTHRIKNSFETLRVKEQKGLRENLVLEYLEDWSAVKMICLMGSQSGFTMVTIFLYTCFWIPFRQLKKALAGIISDVLYLTDFYKPKDQTVCNVDQLSLPVARFQDLQGHSCAERSGHVAETCSVCLVEFEDEDVVSQLSKCSHVFHMDCIEKWIERNNFTCPLCRSLFFNVNTCHVKCDDDFLPHSWQY